MYNGTSTTAVAPTTNFVETTNYTTSNTELTTGTDILVPTTSINSKALVGLTTTAQIRNNIARFAEPNATSNTAPTAHSKSTTTTVDATTTTVDTSTTTVDATNTTTVDLSLLQ